MDIWVILSFCILIHGSRNILVNIFSGVGYKLRARFMSDNNMNMFKFSIPCQFYKAVIPV